MNRWLLWSRFAALNLVGLAGVLVAWINGWIDLVLAADVAEGFLLAEVGAVVDLLAGVLVAGVVVERRLVRLLAQHGFGFRRRRGRGRRLAAAGILAPASLALGRRLDVHRLAAGRAGGRALAQVVELRAAGRAQALLAPLGLGHGRFPRYSVRKAAP